MLKACVFFFAITAITVCHAQDSARIVASHFQARPANKTVVVKPKPAVSPGQPGAVNYQYRKPAIIVKTPAGGQPQTVAAGPQPAPQFAETPVSTDKSLTGQYQYVLSKTYHYQQAMIAALWKNINDTLTATRRTLKDDQSKLAARQHSVDSLQKDVQAKTDNISTAESQRDRISFIGMPMSKSAYNMLMWGLVLALGAALLIVLLRTAGNSREAKYRTKLYDELSEEFQSYKVKSNEKEKKLARELQTERNKIDELTGRG